MCIRFLILTTISVTLIGCSNKQTAELPTAPTPNYTRPLPEGERALRLVSAEQWPDMGDAWDNRDFFLQDSLDWSMGWFDAPSSKQWFPMEGVTHEHAKLSVLEFKTLLKESRSRGEFLNAIETQFNLYESVGCDDNGTVLFTGYYSPDFHASTLPTSDYQSPLYRRPHDLVSHPTTGEPLGRELPSGEIVTWPTREEIESKDLLSGTELVYVADHLDAYTIHVNGSARLRMNNGDIKYIGYAGKTDRPYKGLGESILEAKLVSPDKLSLREIRKLYDKNPKRISELINNNESYVFFQEYDGANWPAGSLGVPVTARRSVATDKSIFPRGGIVLVDTSVHTLTGEQKPFVQFMVDQDTGGAIRAPGRCDLFMGIGATAGIKAGKQYSEGKLYYLFLKPDSLARVEP
ncbi:MAG: MltA domain-containing protein [Planctomycetota bacterium]|nr:MltA domain-containing protein [Planctomycetota bacterium]